MIYQMPAIHDPLDQGDIIDGCPVLQIARFDPSNPTSPQVTCSTHRVVVLT